MINHYNIKINGDVQGVGFRINIYRIAKELDLLGWVRNELDRTVYIEVEGEEINLQKLINYCQTGPTLAKVQTIEVVKGKMKNYSNFEIKY